MLPELTQREIININRLLRDLRRNTGKDISLDDHVSALEKSLSAFNEVPIFTNFSFKSTMIIDLFFNELVMFATNLLNNTGHDFWYDQLRIRKSELISFYKE